MKMLLTGSLVALVIGVAGAAQASTSSRHAMAPVEASHRFDQRAEARALTGEKIVIHRHVRDEMIFKGGRNAG